MFREGEVGNEHEIERYRRALEALRQANRGIDFAGDWDANDWPGERLGPADDETGAGLGGGPALVPGALDMWKKGFRVPQALWPRPAAGDPAK